MGVSVGDGVGDGLGVGVGLSEGDGDAVDEGVGVGLREPSCAHAEGAPDPTARAATSAASGNANTEIGDAPNRRAAQLGRVRASARGGREPT